MIGLGVMLLAVYLYWESSKRYLSIFFVFFTITGGFQLVPSELMVLPTIGITKTYDWALIYVMLITLIMPEIILNHQIWKDRNGLSIFACILCLLLFYSIFHVGVEPQVAIRVFRTYIFFILLLPISQLNHHDFLKVFKLIIYVTSFASLLYCLQPFIGRGILSGAPTILFNSGDKLARFYNLPYYVSPVIFSLFFNRFQLEIKYKSILLSINLFAIIVSQHRNILFSIFACYVLFLILTNGLSIKRVLIYGLISLGVFISVNTYFDNKFSNGIIELTNLSSSVTSLEIYSTDIGNISTTEYRKLHFLERYKYVTKNKLTALFGIGFLTEDAALVRKLSFNIGLITETKEVLQIDNSDIAWSQLILHFGIIGTLVFIYFYFAYIKIIYRCRKEPLYIVGLLYVTTLFTNSFFGTDILLPHAISLLMFILGFYYSRNVIFGKMS